MGKSMGLDVIGRCILTMVCPRLSGRIGQVEADTTARTTHGKTAFGYLSVLRMAGTAGM
jgi:hypothetical protein